MCLYEHVVTLTCCEQRNLSHTSLNRLQLSIYACSISEFTVVSHAIMIVFTTSLDLISFTSLSSRSLTLKFVLLCSNISFNVTLTQQSTSLWKNTIIWNMKKEKKKPSDYTLWIIFSPTLTKMSLRHDDLQLLLC